MLTFDPGDHWSIDPRETRIDEFDPAEYEAMVAAYEAQTKATSVYETEAA